MEQILTHPGKKLQTQKVDQPRWQRIILLSLLGYEGAGALMGGILLIAAPGGRYMDMPVEIMHGVFRDFMVPGIILFGLGILNTAAFVAVLRRTRSDWFMAGLALGGLFIWFIVEIVILQELHWLHAMWGIPVLLGWVMAIPLIALRHETVMMRKALLACGILSSLWYLVINIFVPMQYEGYSSVTQTVSELSAIGAPTRVIWVLLATLYPLLFAAFGWGVVKSAAGNRSLRVAGTLIIVYSVMNFYWPPMHLREVIAAGGGTLTDTLHIVWAMITLLFNMLLMGFGAATSGKQFRLFTIVTFVVFIVFGILIGMEAPGIQANLPTPWIGVWERINIGVFQLWVVVFAIVLLRKEKVAGLIKGNET
ncbi:MAG: DUF998 domain-containing protein [Bacteroidota bacterium]|nr:DUF998 domain-containing protein [Bacteroidota bacterium]